jgi:MFS family permease
MAQGSLTKQPLSALAGAFNQQYGSLVQNANFRLLLISAMTQAIGQILYNLALPLLILHMTGSTTAMGIAIVLAGAPRIVFMMAGGALTDRFSPRVLSAAASLLRALVLTVFTGLVVTKQVNLPVIFALNFLVGLTDAVLIPTGGALVSRLVHEDELKTANSIVISLNHFCGLVGPASAGVILTWISKTGNLPGLAGGATLAAGVAFFLNTIALVLTAVMIFSIKMAGGEFQRTKALTSASQQGSTRELLVFIWRQVNIRASFGLLYLANIISLGPLSIGMPMLAVRRFPEGAQALGFLTSAIACGSLAGAALAGMIPPVKLEHAKLKSLVILAGIFSGLAVLYGSTRIETAMLAVLAVAALVSYVNVVETSQIQRSTPSAYMGRVIGMLNLK